MPEVFVPVPATSDFISHSESDGSYVADTLLFNCIRKVVDDKLMVEQRFGISGTDWSLGGSGKDVGRGVFARADSQVIYVRSDTVYYNSTALTPTITSGVEPVSMVGYGSDKVFILDAENNEAWVQTAASLTQVTDPDFPSNPVSGCVYMNGYIFVMDTSGKIWNSALNDPTSWAATDFITADRYTDSGVRLAQHKNHLVAMCDSSIEFFYLNPSPPATGSVLTKRDDIFYKIGCQSKNSVYDNGEDIYLVGVSGGSQASVYKLSSFELQRISDPRLTKLITQFQNSSTITSFASGLGFYDPDIYLLTFCSYTDFSNTKITLAYDGIGWGVWDTTISGHSNFPIIMSQPKTTEAGAGTFSQFMFSNGDTYTIRTNESDRADMDDTPTSVDVTCKIRFGSKNYDTSKWKFMRELEFDGDYFSGGTVTVKFDDENTNTFSTQQTLDISSRNKLTALGRFARRNIEISNTGSYPFRFMGYRAVIDAGSV